MAKTRIIATLGPASSSPAALRGMFDAGLDVARLNFSHGSVPERLALMAAVRRLNGKRRRRVRLLADLKGNRIRIGRLGKPVELRKNQTVFLSRGASAKESSIPFDYKGDMSRVKKGFLIYIDDGNIRLEALSVLKDSIKCRVAAPALLKERKGVNIPAAHLDFPKLSAEDRADLDFAIDGGFDFIAQSFVRDAEDVLAIREIALARKCPAKIVAKIEAREALENIDAVIAASDCVMVARGDMGITFPVWQIPVLQKRIIRRCNLLKKPVITATQMLESMTGQKIPTRAEVSDVANAILDGSDYVMLSGETSVGAYPAETVRMMNEIIKYTEAHRSAVAGPLDG